MHYKIHYSCLSHIGNVRSVNQDNFICDGRYMENDETPIEFPICGTKTSKEVSVFGIFDGMGGEECGEIASYIASKTASDIEMGKDATEALSKFCQKANLAICDYATLHEVTSMGTTAAMLVFTEKEVALCNIGDSKIFRLCDGKLEQISMDHVAVAAFGVKPPLSQNLGIPPNELVIDPYLARGPYNDGDTYLICSDGLPKDIIITNKPKGKRDMKKAIVIISSITLLLAVIAGGIGMYIVNTPEYALKTMIDDVNTSGMAGLEPHLTGNAKETLDTVSSITSSDLFNTLMGFINQNDYVSVLKSEIQEVQWEMDDVLKSNENAAVILSFNYEDKLIGTIEISMIKESGDWKIDGIEFPEFREINWQPSETVQLGY